MYETQFIPPDGGWGWMVVIGVSLNTMIMIPILQGFAMVHGPHFKQLGISATKSSLIINVNQGFGMIVGLINGPLLRAYGYRKIAICGSILISSGMILTAFARSFVHFIITYGMMTSLGMSMCMSAGMIALNTYFKEKRGQAVGISMTITGLGSIFMPLLISLLLPIYNSHETTLILGGLSLHTLAGALLLHPIEWHIKPRDVIKENEKKKTLDVLINSEKNPVINNSIKSESLSLFDGAVEENVNDVPKNEKHKRIRKNTMSLADMSDDSVSIYGFETPVYLHDNSLLDIFDWTISSKDSQLKVSKSSSALQKYLASNSKNDFPKSRKRSSYFFPSYDRSVSYNEAKVSEFNREQAKHNERLISKKILDYWPEENVEHGMSSDEECTGNAINFSIEPPTPEIEAAPPLVPKLPKKEQKKNLLHQSLSRISRIFDLDLLCDPVYVNILLGMAVSSYVDINFSVLTPFICADAGLDMHQTATLMSLLASADLVCRALAPYFSQTLRMSPRVMYLLSLCLLIATRTGLLLSANNYSLFLIGGIFLGIAKGFRTVSAQLILPSHVPLEKLVSASSIQSLLNGLLLMFGGPILGSMKDSTGSYLSCIIFMNVVSSITLVLWLGEFIIKRIKKLRKLDKEISV